MVQNEFVGYLDSNYVKANPNALDKRSIVLASYALCGFANFSSIAIQSTASVRWRQLGEPISQSSVSSQ